MNRPFRSTANKNPAQIIIDNTQKRHTSKQKRADEATEAANAKDLRKRAELEYQAKIAEIASMEDRGDDSQTADPESPRNIEIPDSGDDSDTFRPDSAKMLERDDSGDEDEEEEPADEDIEDELSDRGNGKQKAKKVCRN
ncbi:hypothetical protein BDN67DRAFT_1018019 [Paxillus ammoniavirescens]|nr:hypothetical protein BDN67DRAFT_1018019 [Paxillus ammoniavirescens]